MRDSCLALHLSHRDLSDDVNSVSLATASSVNKDFFLFELVRDRSKIRGGGGGGWRAGAFLLWPTSFGETLPIPGAEKMLTPQNSLHNLSRPPTPPLLLLPPPPPPLTDVNVEGVVSLTHDQIRYLKEMAKNGKISEKALSTIEEYIPGLLKENGQLSVTEDHQSESTGSESESDLEQ